MTGRRGRRYRRETWPGLARDLGLDWLIITTLFQIVQVYQALGSRMLAIPAAYFILKWALISVSTRWGKIVALANYNNNKLTYKQPSLPLPAPARLPPVRESTSCLASKEFDCLYYTPTSLKIDLGRRGWCFHAPARGRALFWPS